MGRAHLPMGSTEPGEVRLHLRDGEGTMACAGKGMS